MASSFLQMAGGSVGEGGFGALPLTPGTGVKRRESIGCIPAIEDPNYFEELPPEEIYDSFFSIKRMGFLANRIIRKLNDTKYIISSHKILEKRKKFKLIQRKQFEQLSPSGVEYLKVLMKAGKFLV
ncbi:hypothetical protein EON65_20635 [archaeon]|nr:MAG: hypothetical protein EON65_20635 [archaeon]